MMPSSFTVIDLANREHIFHASRCQLIYGPAVGGHWYAIKHGTTWRSPGMTFQVDVMKFLAAYLEIAIMR